MSRTVKGVDTRYLVLDIRNSNLTFSVPEHSADEVGLRSILDPHQIAEVFDVLRAPTAE